MNSHLLTHSHTVYKAKKRAKQQQIKEILFDDSARYEYLTGFHKRNLLKKEAAVKRAKDREHEARLDARREQRRSLKQQAIENAAMVEKAYRELNNDDEDDTEFTGFSVPDTNGKGQQKDDAYEDDEQLATVTVVEEFDPDTLLHPSPTHPSRDSSSSPHSDAGEPVKLTPPHGRVSIKDRPTVKSKSKPSHTSKGPTKKKIPYETKAARKAQSSKQRARRTEKAERAGGTNARSSRGAREGRRGGKRT